MQGNERENNEGSIEIRRGTFLLCLSAAVALSCEVVALDEVRQEGDLFIGFLGVTQEGRLNIRVMKRPRSIEGRSLKSPFFILYIHCEWANLDIGKEGSRAQGGC